MPTIDTHTQTLPHAYKESIRGDKKSKKKGRKKKKAR